MRLVSLKSAILGFLALEPTTGYTLQQRFQGSVGSFWTATQSQIYRELHALEREAWVVVEVVPQDGKPARKVYSLTDAGREELARWLAEPVAPAQLRDPLLLKLVFASEVEPARLSAILTDYANSLAETRAEYRARLEAREIFALARSEREALLWQLAIENGLDWCEAQIAWTKKALRRLEGVPTKSVRRASRSRKEATK